MFSIPRTKSITPYFIIALGIMAALFVVWNGIVEKVDAGHTPGYPYHCGSFTAVCGITVNNVCQKSCSTVPNTCKYDASCGGTCTTDASCAGSATACSGVTPTCYGTPRCDNGGCVTDCSGCYRGSPPPPPPAGPPGSPPPPPTPPPPSSPTKGTILGSIFNDLNGNDIYEPAEGDVLIREPSNKCAGNPLDDVFVESVSGPESFANKEATKCKGTGPTSIPRYLVSGLKPGNYVLTTRLPTGWTQVGLDKNAKVIAGEVTNVWFGISMGAVSPPGGPPGGPPPGGVPPEGDPFVDLRATPPFITEGQSSRLDWTTTNAENGCTISANPGDPAFGTGPIAVCPDASSCTSGTRTVSPVKSTTYELICENAVGDQGSDAITVQVGTIIEERP